MGRSPCCDEVGLKRGPWTPEEDKKLRDYVQKNGHGSWRRLPKLAGLNRCGKSCRLRWINYLRPDIKRGNFTEEEESLIIDLHSLHGNKWSTIAASLPGRTDNEIKNYWNTHLRKKLLRMGIDPVTHQPRTDLRVLPGLPELLTAANLVGGFTSSLNDPLHLQADAAHLIKLHLVQNLVQVLTSNPTPNLNQIMGLFGSAVLRNYRLNDVDVPSAAASSRAFFVIFFMVHYCREQRRWPRTFQLRAGRASLTAFIVRCLSPAVLWTPETKQLQLQQMI
ncbi:unnamed protein product [Musa textilis]